MTTLRKIEEQISMAGLSMSTESLERQIKGLWASYEGDKMEPGQISKHATMLLNEVKDSYATAEKKKELTEQLNRLLKNLGAA